MRRPLPLASLLLAFAASAQTPEFQARLEGQVVDPLHEPVPNAEVVVEHDGIVVATTRSDGQGTFVFPRVPAQFVVVRATTDAPDIGGRLVDLWGEDRGFALIRTMPARRLSGTVRTDAGDPVAGAWVLASPQADSELAWSQCVGQADARGHFELPHVAMGPVRVRAWTEQHDAEAFVGAVDGTSDASLDCVVVRDEAEWCTFLVRGATAEQLATAELRVMALHRGIQVPLPPPLARPSPREPGVWDVNGWTTADEIHAWVILDGATMWPGEQVIPIGTGTLKRRFRVGDPDGRIVGQLRNADGKPAAGVRLLAQPIRRRLPALNCSRRSAVSAADGSFVVQSPLDVDDRNFAVRSMSPSTVLVGNDKNPVWFVQRHAGEREWSIEIRPADSLAMHVEDREGTPLFGASATLWSADRGRAMILGHGTSHLDGSLEIRCLALGLPRSLRLVLRSPEGLGVVARTLTAGDAPYLGRIRLEPAATIRGIVLRGDGSPIPGARVSIMDMAPGLHQPFVVAADRAGRFKLPGLRAGQFDVSACGDDQRVTLTAGLETSVSLAGPQ